MSTKVFISPHNDDETLFGAFTIMRERPLVIVVYDSFVQVARGDPACDCMARRHETVSALEVMLGYDEHDSVPESRIVKFAGLHDDTPYHPTHITQAILMAIPFVFWDHVTDIYAPAYEEGGHDQHNLVAQAANTFRPHTTHRYLTYTRNLGKSRMARLSDHVKPVPRTADMIRRKHLAMACYTTQIANPSTQSWFTQDIEEYYA